MASEPHDITDGHGGSENPRNDQSVEIDLSTGDAVSPLQEKSIKQETDKYRFYIAVIVVVIIGAILFCGLLPQSERYSNYIKAIEPVFSPFLGVILGYYFGSRHLISNTTPSPQKRKKAENKKRKTM